MADFLILNKPFTLNVSCECSQNLQGFTPQLVEHCTGIAEGMASNPVLACFFCFRPKCHSCLSCMYNCDDESYHSSRAILWEEKHSFIHLQLANVRIRTDCLSFFSCRMNSWKMSQVFSVEEKYLFFSITRTLSVSPWIWRERLFTKESKTPRKQSFNSSFDASTKSFI